LTWKGGTAAVVCQSHCLVTVRTDNLKHEYILPQVKYVRFLYCARSYYCFVRRLIVLILLLALASRVCPNGSTFPIIGEKPHKLLKGGEICLRKASKLSFSTLRTGTADDQGYLALSATPTQWMSIPGDPIVRYKS